MAVQGLNSLLKKMELVPQRVLEAARTALEQNAEEMVAMMRRLVPRDKGDLARSIGWTWGDAPAGTMTLGRVKGSGAAYSSMTITIYAGGGKAFYAWWQEVGTKNMPASPFFFPAYRALKGKAKSRVTRAMRKAIKLG